MYNWDSSSQIDPIAIFKYFTNILELSNALPSDIFEEIEIADLFICETKPYRSESGKHFVKE